jgi:RNA polymerase sigma factor (sigma-70 family)
MTQDQTAKADDGQIAGMLADKSELGLRLLLDVHGPRVLWLLRERFDQVLAEPDLLAVLNDAAWKAFEAGAQYDPARGTLGGWFWLIAANAARDAIRSEVRHAHAPMDYDPPDEVRPPASLDEPDDPSRQRLLKDLDEAVEALPDMQRRILRADLAAGDTTSAAILAESFGTSEASIYVSRNKARAAVRDELRRRGHFLD